MGNHKAFDRDNNNYCKDTEAAAAQLFSSSGSFGGDGDSTNNNMSESDERDNNGVLWGVETSGRLK